MKKLFTAILALATCFCLCFSFTACDTRTDENNLEPVGEPITFEEGITAYRSLETYLNGTPIAPDSYTVNYEMNFYLPTASSDFYKSSSHVRTQALQLVNDEYSAYSKLFSATYTENGTETALQTNNETTICKDGTDYFKFTKNDMKKIKLDNTPIGNISTALDIELQFNYDYLNIISELDPSNEYLEESKVTLYGQKCYAFTKKDNTYYCKITITNQTQTKGTSDSILLISFNDTQVLTATGTAEFKNEADEITNKMNVSYELKNSANITKPEGNYILGEAHSY